MKIIPYNAEWRNKMLKLHDEAMEEFNSFTKPKNESIDLINTEKHYQNNKGVMYLGVENDQLIAMGGLRFKSSTQAELKRMRIRMDKRGQGLGTELLIHLESVALKIGITELFLETAMPRSKTLKFYEKHGYSRFQEGHYGSIPIVKYQKQIGSKHPLQTALPSHASKLGVRK